MAASPNQSLTMQERADHSPAEVGSVEMASATSRIQPATCWRDRSSLARSILQCLGEVRGLDGVGACEVGHGGAPQCWPMKSKTIRFQISGCSQKAAWPASGTVAN